MQASTKQPEAVSLPASRRRKGERGRDGSARAAKPYRFADLSAYSLKQRLLIRIADRIFHAIIALIGRTTRFEIEGWENYEQVGRAGHVPIYTSWHNRVFLATYFWRRRHIVVMTSQSFDGEYIARFIQRFGYGATRGSSTRGGVGALVEMARLMRCGQPSGFTIDGPRGPRQVAKMGAVLLAKKTGHPVLPFSINSSKYFTAPSWDALQVPLPFARARVRIASPIYVPADADAETLEAKRAQLQRALDDIN